MRVRVCACVSLYIIIIRRACSCITYANHTNRVLTPFLISSRSPRRQPAVLSLPPLPLPSLLPPLPTPPRHLLAALRHRTLRSALSPPERRSAHAQRRVRAHAPRPVRDDRHGAHRVSAQRAGAARRPLLRPAWLRRPGARLGPRGHQTLSVGAEDLPRRQLRVCRRWAPRHAANVSF